MVMVFLSIIFPASILNAFRLPDKKPPFQQQKNVLKRLLEKAKYTSFGHYYSFEEILMSANIEEEFKQRVPIFTYNSLYKEWWSKTLEGQPNVCWPGKIKYYALSSGTSESASKYIPITNDLLRRNKRVMVKQLLSLLHYENVPLKSVGRGWLTLGGSTVLEKNRGYYTGDLSGITQKKAPLWFQPFYKPGRKIAKQKDWNKKLEEIVEKAPQWDIGFIVGVPAWIQMLMEMIIKRYNLQNIHEIWPNLAFYVHGGVSFDPYQNSFKKLLGKPITYIETYLASEGFLAYQYQQDSHTMKLVLNEHVYFEFIPFNEKNFDENGDLMPNPQVINIQEIAEGEQYAILISTMGGCWRYLIGDTIKFADKEKAEIVITGRTKHFLSLVGEHLSVENMNQAIQKLSEKYNISIPEYTVAGVPNDTLFAHHWYIACNDKVNAPALLKDLDRLLQTGNDDYAVERKTALNAIFLDILKEDDFVAFMEMKKKLGSQHKFPRVLKGKLLAEWQAFVETRKTIPTLTIATSTEK